jgi:hypothetical protein
MYAALLDKGRRRSRVEAANLLGLSGSDQSKKVRIHRWMVKHGIPRDPKRTWKLTHKRRRTPLRVVTEGLK